MSPAIPHFAFPFRIDASGSVAVNEQDSPDDIVDCVALICSYPVGSRIEKPGFGVPDQTFAQAGVETAPVEAAITRWEPRALPHVEADQSSLAELVSAVTVEIGAATP